MKKLLRVFVLIVILAGVGTWIGFTLYQNKQILEEKNEPQKIEDRIEVYPVKVSRVSRREIRDTLQLQGNFEARKELRIIAEAQGRLSQLYIDDGDRVRKGEVVGKIDDTSLQSRLATARASYEQAAKDVERYQRLYEAGAVSLKQYEEVQLAAKNARTDLTSIEQQLEYTNVKSPMSGTLDEVAVEQGSFVSPGAPIGTVVDISRLLLVVQVPEAEVVKLREGERVPVYADVYPRPAPRWPHPADQRQSRRQPQVRCRGRSAQYRKIPPAGRHVRHRGIQPYRTKGGFRAFHSPQKHRRQCQTARSVCFTAGLHGRSTPYPSGATPGRSHRSNARIAGRGAGHHHGNDRPE